MTEPPVLQIRSLSRRVGDKDIIRDITFTFERSRIYTVMGPSGAGKSSLLRLLNHLDEPTCGEVLFHGQSTTEVDPCRLRCKIGYLFQSPHLFPETIRDNLLYAECALDDAAVDRLMKLVHLESSLLNSKVDRLSGGQAQRVAIGRLLATRPEVLLLDEPTSALDPSLSEAIENTVKEIIRETGVTVIMVTHRPDQSLRMGGEALLLVDGKLVEHGPVEQVVREPKTELGRKYRDKELR